MKVMKIIVALWMGFFLISSVAIAGEFDWTRDLNIKAEIDPSGFVARLGARFNIGEAEIRTVLSNAERPADAYMMLRLGAMSGHRSDYVIEEYKSKKGNGWGNLAKSLGIKPGSKEFQALKNGHDLYNFRNTKGKKENHNKDKKQK